MTGPVIEAIEAGHIATVADSGPFHGDLVCAASRDRWPCAVIVVARGAQRGYAERLQRNALIAAVTKPAITATR